MNEQLKMRSGIALIIARVISLALLIVAVWYAYLGFVDPRTEEEKAEEYRLSVVNSALGERAIEAIRYADKKLIFASYERVVVLTGTSQKYVKIVGRGFDGESVTFCYDAAQKTEIYSQLFDRAVSIGAVNDHYAGREAQDRTQEYEDAELEMLLEEARAWH